MNFISAFNELEKLYEGVETEVEKEDPEETSEETVAEEACIKEELTEATEDEVAEDEEIEIVDDEEPVDEIPAEEYVEEPAEESIEEGEPKQVIIECDKCGALVIVDETDVKVDEETDLVNVDTECKFCEEKVGYKILGSMVPYEATESEEEPTEEAEEPAAEEPVEDAVI